MRRHLFFVLKERMNFGNCLLLLGLPHFVVVNRKDVCYNTKGLMVT